MDTKICNLFKNDNFTIELHVHTDGHNNAQEVRLYIMDSDNRWMDDWAYDVGEDISEMLDIIASYSKDCNYFSAFIAEAFDKEVYYNVSLQEYHDMIIKYGAEFVNRIGGCVLVTKE